jgi:hypothetical protein
MIIIMYLIGQINLLEVRNQILFPALTAIDAHN